MWALRRASDVGPAAAMACALLAAFACACVATPVALGVDAESPDFGPPRERPRRSPHSSVDNTTNSSAGAAGAAGSGSSDDWLADDMHLAAVIAAAVVVCGCCCFCFWWCLTPDLDDGPCPCPVSGVRPGACAWCTPACE